MHTAVISPLEYEYILIYFPVILLPCYCFCSHGFTFFYLAASNKKKNLGYRVPLFCTDFRSYWLCVYIKYTDREGIFGPDYKNFLIASLL